MLNPPKFSFTRMVRTQSSEQYIVRCPTNNPDSHDRIGHLDLHFDGFVKDVVVHGTLILEVILDDESLDAILREIDNQFVPGLREDSIINVFQGTEIDTYCDSKESED